MNPQEFDDYELGGEGMVPFSMDDGGKISSVNSGIVSDAKPASAFRGTFGGVLPKTYNPSKVGNDATSVPAGFIASENQSARMDEVPPGFNPLDIWNFKNE